MVRDALQQCIDLMREAQRCRTRYAAICDELDAIRARCPGSWPEFDKALYDIATGDDITTEVTRLNPPGGFL